MSSVNERAGKYARYKLTDLIYNFLKAIPIAIKAEIGPIPKRKQCSSWMIYGISGSHSESFERLIFPRDFINDVYMKNKFNNKILPEETELRIVLEEIGISKAFEIPDLPRDIPPIKNNIIISDLCSKLVSNWLDLENPFLFEEPAMSNLIEDFLDAVLDGKLILRKRLAIEGLDGECLPATICNGIIIRRISKEELWELGDHTNIQNNLIYLHQYYPSDKWNILDVKLSQDGAKPSMEMYELVDALLVLLRLSASGGLKLFDLGLKFNYGSPGTIRSHLFPMNIMGSGKAYSLDAILIERLQNYWPQIRSIMESKSHFLRLPARRLLDGGLRKEQSDAILDYSIGLESLLTNETSSELSYRLALRGATILSWNGRNKKEYYENLIKFYKIRSSIVHGSYISEKRKKELKDAYENGERYLREIFWWFLTERFIDPKKGIKEGTDIVDNRILNTDCSMDA
jgi:hypothetical protein